MSAAKQSGFTLLEILMVLAIFAIAAGVVIMVLPSDNSQIQRAEQMKTVMEYASERAVLEGKPLGLSLTAGAYRFVVLGGTLPLIPQTREPQWEEIESSRMPVSGELAENETLSLSPLALNKSINRPPQIVFMPDGTLSVFELSFTSSASEPACCSIISEGRLPLILHVRRSEK
ncbi:type II secretion system protein GspH [Rahnella aquatilis]|nr:type II secretion system protein GspH [Rahnella aquatilis]